jgi:secondary thiamine-phosphate synthase enzyme
MEGIREFPVRTSRREEMVDITALVQRAVGESGIGRGVCHVFVPHTTCGLTINEHADPDVARDILETLNKMVPDGAGYRHREGNSPAHIKASLMGAGQTVPVAGGRLCLGTWQGIFLCEFDGPRQRKFWVRTIEAV